MSLERSMGSVDEHIEEDYIAGYKECRKGTYHAKLVISKQWSQSTSQSTVKSAENVPPVFTMPKTYWGMQTSAQGLTHLSTNTDYGVKLKKKATAGRK